MIGRLLRWLRRKDLAAFAGCCTCGTGGRYHNPADGLPLTRYVYVGATRRRGYWPPDWASCSEHPLDEITPVVDYGTDVLMTNAEIEHDAINALATDGPPRRPSSGGDK